MSEITLERARSFINSADIAIVGILARYEARSAELSQNSAKFLTDLVAKTLSDCPQEMMIATLERLDLSEKQPSITEQDFISLATALRQRFDAAVFIALAKEVEGRTTSYDEPRHTAVLDANQNRAKKDGADDQMVRDIFANAIMANLVKYQDQYLQHGTGPIAWQVMKLAA